MKKFLIGVLVVIVLGISPTVIAETIIRPQRAAKPPAGWATGLNSWVERQKEERKRKQDLEDAKLNFQRQMVLNGYSMIRPDEMNTEEIRQRCIRDPYGQWWYKP